MRCSFNRPHRCNHRPNRRWLAALVVACCTTSTAAAQLPPTKSAHLFKSAAQAPKVRPETAQAAQLQPAQPLHLNGGMPAADAVPAPAEAVPTPSAPAGRLPAGQADPADAYQNALRLPGGANALGSAPVAVRPSDAGSSFQQRVEAGQATTDNQQGDNQQGDGQDEYQLTLPALENMALGANPSLGRASAAVAAARGAAVQAGLPFNPTVGYEGQQIGSGGLAEQHGVLVSQEFLRHEKRTLSREVACREVQMAEYRYMAQRARVLTDVRIAYYRVLRAQRQIDANTALLKIAEQAHKAAKALVEAKEIARTDELQAQIEVEVAQNALSNARDQHQSAWNQLMAVTGQSQLQVVALDGDLFAPGRDLEFDAVLAWLRGRSPEVAVATANVERARLYWQRQRAEPHPNLSVQSLYNFVDNGIGGKPDAAVAVSVPVPLYNRNQGAIQEARYQVVVAERSLAQLELALQQRLAPVFERYSIAQNSVQQYGQRILPAAGEVLQLTQKTFEVGEIGFTNLLLAQRSYRQQQLLYLDAAEALRVAEAEIDGLLLSGSLTEPPPP